MPWSPKAAPKTQRHLEQTSRVLLSMSLSFFFWVCHASSNPNFLAPLLPMNATNDDEDKFMSLLLNMCHFLCGCFWVKVLSHFRIPQFNRSIYVWDREKSIKPCDWLLVWFILAHSLFSLNWIVHSSCVINVAGAAAAVSSDAQPHAQLKHTCSLLALTIKNDSNLCSTLNNNNNNIKTLQPIIFLLLFDNGLEWDGRIATGLVPTMYKSQWDESEQKVVYLSW